MSTRPLDERRRALEEEFFKRENERLRQKLADDLQLQAQRQDLARACGIEDQAVLDALLARGIAAETVTVLALIPLVAVAWANGTLKDGERDAILRAAHEAGIDKGSPGYDLLSSWLAAAPSPRLFESWRRYMEPLREALDDQQRTSLKSDIAGRARQVAEAAGGILGIGSVSAAEAAILDQIESAF